MKDLTTVLTFLEGAQTVIALYEGQDGPENRQFAFKALKDILNDRELLAAQLRLKVGHDTVILISGEPNGQTIVLAVRPN